MALMFGYIALICAKLAESSSTGDWVEIKKGSCARKFDMCPDCYHPLEIQQIKQESIQ